MAEKVIVVKNPETQEEIPVVFNNLSDATEKEAKNYVEYVNAHKGKGSPPVSSIEVTLCSDGKVDVSYLAVGDKFERIRRITG